MLRKVRFILNRFTLEKMYFSFIRPILEYGDVKRIILNVYDLYLVEEFDCSFPVGGGVVLLIF
jgi:hypothetical protein